MRTASKMASHHPKKISQSKLASMLASSSGLLSGFSDLRAAAG